MLAEKIRVYTANNDSRAAKITSRAAKIASRTEMFRYGADFSAIQLRPCPYQNEGPPTTISPIPRVPTIRSFKIFLLKS